MSDVFSLVPKVPQSFDERQAVQRLLIPLKRQDDANPSIAYAIRRRAEGSPVVIALLHVEALVAPWPITGIGQYVRTQRKPRTGNVFSESLRMLKDLDIEYSTHLIPGPVVFSILDTAEQLACSEIVVPAPGRLHLRCLSENVATTLVAWQRSIPVVMVNKRGITQQGGAKDTVVRKNI